MRLVGSQSKTSTLISTRLSTSSKDFVNASNHVDSRPKSHDVHTQKYATPTRHHLVFAKEQNDSTNSPQNILTRPEDILTQCLGCPSPPDSGKTPDVGTTLLTSAEKRNCLKAYLQKPVNLQCCTKNALPFDSPVKNKLISEGVEGGIDVKPFILGRGGFGTVVLANWKGSIISQLIQSAVDL